jgi:hypothetical protein
VKQAIVPFIGCIGLVTIIGCAGTGEVIPIHLRATPAAAEKAAAPSSPLRVAIGAFEDGRQHQTGLGVRTHIWGGVSYFDVPGSTLTDAVAHALTEYLTAKGWRVVKPGNSEGADVVIAGKLQEFIVHAKSRVGFTEITAKTKFALQATNSADGSVVRMVLHGSGAEDVFWFDADDVEDVINEVLTDSFSKLTQDTAVVNRMFRLKEQ